MVQGKEYPWDEWFNNSREKKLVKGRHFDCMLHSMSILARQAAAKRGKRVRIRIDEEKQCLYIKIGDPL